MPKHNSLVSQAGLDAALGCQSSLVENGFDNVHVIIVESIFSLLNSKNLDKPTITANPVAVIREPFPTSLGISIYPGESPNLAPQASSASTRPSLVFSTSSLRGMSSSALVRKRTSFLPSAMAARRRSC